MKTQIDARACGVRAAVATFAIVLSIAVAGCSGGSTGGLGGPTNTTGPLVIAAQYVDVDGNGVDGGDIIVVTFGSSVRIISASVASFRFDSDLDSFGSGAVLSQTIPNSERVEILLGSGADLVPAVSTVDVRSGTSLNVVDLSGDDARQTTAIIPVDDLTAIPPTLVGSCYIDNDLDGVIDVGDTLVCAFDKPISIPGGATFAANFTMPVTGDTLGTTPTLSAFSPSPANRGVQVTIDSAPTLTVTGTFDSAIVTAGSPSGIEMSGAPTIEDTLTSLPNAATPSTQGDVSLQIESYFHTSQEGSLFLGNVDGNTPDVAANGFDAPGGMAHFNDSVQGSPVVDLFFVADTRNHRVLVFEGLPAGNNGSASVVLGQADFSANFPNRSESGSAAPTSASLHTPVDVHFHAATNQLFVSDAGNHRVLVFNGVVNTATGDLTLTNGAFASFVVGQANTGTGTSNQGSTPSSRTLSSPGGIHVQGTQLAVADTGNHRVLIWNSIPSVSNAPASLVLGQADFVSNSPDAGLGTIDGSVLDGPEDVVLDSTVTVNGFAGAVVVADSGNNRVLVWHGTNPGTGSAADRVLGQAAFTTFTAGAGLDEFDAPRGVEIFPTSGAFTSGDSIFVCDANNDRVTVFDFGGPLANGDTAAQSIGGTGAPATTTLSQPMRVSLSVGTADFLFVADSMNHRVMQFPVTAGTAAATATTEQGQPSFLTAKPKGHTANQPWAVAFSGGKMIVCDTENHRVLIYNTTPTAGDPDPDVVIGQLTLFETEANQGLSAPTAATLRNPSGVATDGTRLVIADTGNNRVLVFSSIPTTDGDSAAVVLGQAGMTGASPNAGGISAATLDSPVGLDISGTQLIVCDRDNHRVVTWNDVTTVTDGAAANVVLGQGDFSSRLPNHGDVTSATTLHTPLDAKVIAGLLFVVDSLNHRVVAYSSTTTSSIGAIFALGQASLTGNAAGIGSFGLNAPSGVASDGLRFYISDRNNHRVLVYHSVPNTSGLTADAVIGQASLSGNSPNRGLAAPTEMSLYGPRGMFFDGTTLWIADTMNSRVLRVR